MRKITPCLLLLLLPLVGICQTEFQRGLSWFDQRTDGAEGIVAKREPTERAIGHFEKAMTTGNELEAGVFLIRSLIFKGRFVETDPKLQTKALGQAKDIAERLLPKYPNDRDLRFEHLAALGLWGESLGILRAAREGIATRMVISSDAIWSKYMIEQRSIALDGTTLTLTKVTENTCEVWLIPHTKLHTTFMQKHVKDLINIEVDITGKYIEKMMGNR
jgi:hypothetical protein